MTETTDWQLRLCSDKTVIIADGGTVSGAADLSGTSLLAIDIPAGFDGTSMTFQVSSDGTTFYDYKRMVDGLAVTAVVGANASYATNANDFAGYSHIKLVSATQTGAITITLKTRPL